MSEERIEDQARVLLSDAMAEVKAERRATGKPLHGWKSEACLRAIIRAIENNVRPHSEVLADGKVWDDAGE